ncbi:MAG: hypothetical protein MRY59_13660 [Aquisalinus sp.]|nr:hypothetical protein [Aquisalinus sp.]
MMKTQMTPPSDEELVAELRWLVHRVMQAAGDSWGENLRTADNPELAMTRCVRALGTIARTVERLTGLEELPVQDPRTGAFLAMRKRLNTMLAGFSFSRGEASTGEERAKTFTETVADAATTGSHLSGTSANDTDASVS